MGNMSPGFQNMLGNVFGPQSSSRAPVVQQQNPQVMQAEKPKMNIEGMLSMFVNQMMGNRSPATRPQFAPQATSPRDAMISMLMGGGNGR